jgi:hypothetical protein
MSPDPALRPIFVFGSGRSGTTLLFDLLHAHPDVAWVSRLTDRIPSLPQQALLSRSRLLRRSPLFQPSTDAIGTYRHCGITVDLLKAKGTSLTEDDVTEESARRLRGVVRAHARAMGKPRFINKSTMNAMRIRMIHRIFPDAYFVHILRNGYAVASSLVRVKWWPDADIWWLGTTPRQWQGDQSELAAMNWKRQVGEILEQKPRIPKGQFVECRYEELLSDPAGLVRRIADHCGLEWSDSYASVVGGKSIDPRNRDKWKDQLGADAKQTIRRVAGDLLEELGYDTTA